VPQVSRLSPGFLRANDREPAAVSPGRSGGAGAGLWGAEYRQKPYIPQATFALATNVDVGTLVPTLRQVVQSVDRNLPLLDIRTQDEQIAAGMQHERIFANLTAAFGVLALILACIGIYSIMASMVSRRTHEIGIRMELGARS
jgi:hypothetical protein